MLPAYYSDVFQAQPYGACDSGLLLFECSLNHGNSWQLTETFFCKFYTKIRTFQLQLGEKFLSYFNDSIHFAYLKN